MNNAKNMRMNIYQIITIILEFIIHFFKIGRMNFRRIELLDVSKMKTVKNYLYVLSC